MFQTNSGANELQTVIFNTAQQYIQQITAAGQIQPQVAASVSHTLNSGALMKFCQDFHNHKVNQQMQMGMGHIPPQYTLPEIQNGVVNLIVGIIQQLNQMQQQQVQFGQVAHQPMAQPHQAVITPQGYQPNQMHGGQVMFGGQQQQPAVISPSRYILGNQINPSVGVMRNDAMNPLAEVYGGPKVDLNPRAVGVQVLPADPNNIELRNAPTTRMETTQPPRTVSPADVASATNTIHQATQQQFNQTETVGVDVAKLSKMMENYTSMLDDYALDEDVESIVKQPHSEILRQLQGLMTVQDVQACHELSIYQTEGGSEIMFGHFTLDAPYSSLKMAKADLFNFLKKTKVRLDYPKYAYLVNFTEMVPIDVPYDRAIANLNPVKAQRELVTSKLTKWRGFYDAIEAMDCFELSIHLRDTFIKLFNRGARCNLTYTGADNKNHALEIDEMGDVFTIFDSDPVNRAAVHAYTGTQEKIIHATRLTRFVTDAICMKSQPMYLDVRDNDEHIEYALAREDNGIRYTNKVSRLLHVPEVSGNDEDLASRIDARTELSDKLTERIILLQRRTVLFTNMALPHKYDRMTVNSVVEEEYPINALQQIAYDAIEHSPLIELEIEGTDELLYIGRSVDDRLTIYRE